MPKTIVTILDGWQQRADHYESLLRDVAVHRSNTTQTYAEAFLAAEGPVEARIQAAKLAAGPDKLAADEAAARLAAYELIIAVWQAELAAPTPPEQSVAQRIMRALDELDEMEGTGHGS
jgi:hypothetical protein